MEIATDNQLLALAFGLWSIVVAYGVWVLKKMREDVHKMSKELHLYIVDTEARFAVLEDREGITNERHKKRRNQ